MPKCVSGAQRDRKGRSCATAVLILLASALVDACGGGGGGSSSPPAAWSVGALGPWPTLGAQCAAPRSGLDPYTGLAYPDKQGTLLDEQNWLAAWTNDTYLWYSDVAFVNPSAYTTALAYFDVLKSPLTTASGKPKDQFHFTYSTAVWEALSSSGTQAGYGATWSLVSTAPPRQAVVAYTEPGSPAVAPGATLARGAQVLFVDGINLVTDNTQAGVDALNAGLFPATVGESHTFVVQDLGAASTRSITLVSANVVSTPVQDVSKVPGAAPGQIVGYMLFNDHLATAEPALYSAVTQLNAWGVTDLVLDMRYNSGGYLDIASELAYMIAGPSPTSGKTFDSIKFNSRHPSIDPVQGTPITPTPFHATTQGIDTSFAAGQALPHLDLSRVFILTGPDTCSASEAVINGLNGVGVQVIQIGSTTCGKPYGFYPADNCGTTYFSIQFQGVNQAGFGNYPDGFVPQNGPSTGFAAGAILPGCQVADDFTQPLGNPLERRFAAALQYQAGASCPAATAIAVPGLMRPLAASDGRVFKPPFLTNRIMRARAAVPNGK